MTTGLNLCVLTISDSRTEAQDASGNYLCEALQTDGHRLSARGLLPDDKYRIRALLSRWIADPEVDGILCTGGTGFTGRDSTPEAVQPLLDKEMPGFGELFRWISYQKIATSTVQSRATAAVADGTYIFVLPGSTGACKDAWDDILVHQLDYRHMPCNFVELMPRLNEHKR